MTLNMLHRFVFLLLFLPAFASAQVALPQGFGPAGSVVDLGGPVAWQRADLAAARAGGVAECTVNGPSSTQTNALLASEFCLSLPANVNLQQVRVRTRASYVGRGKATMTVVVNGIDAQVARPPQGLSSALVDRVIVAQAADLALSAVDACRVTVELRFAVLGDSTSPRLNEPDPPRGPVDGRLEVDSIEVAFDYVLATPFPGVSAPLAALWTTDGAVHSGPGTSVTQINDLSGNEQTALPTAGFDTGVYFPADQYGPDRIEFSVNPTTNPPQPAFDAAPNAATTRYLAVMQRALDTGRDFAVVVWCRHRAALSYNGSGQRKPQQILFGSDTADGLGLARGLGIGTFNGRLRYQNIAHNDQFSADSPEALRPCVYTQGPGTYIWNGTHQGSTSYIETYGLGTFKRSPRRAGPAEATVAFNIGTVPSVQHFWAGDLYGIAVFSGSLSAADRAALEAYGHERWGTRLSESRRIVYEGDSIMFGSYSTFNRNAPNLAEVSTLPGTGYANLAIPGGWIVGGPPQYPFVTRNNTTRNINNPEQITLRNVYAPNTAGLPATLVLAIGTNDLAVNLTGSVPDAADDQVLANRLADAIVAYVQSARAVGFAPIYVCTLPNSCGPQPDNALSASSARVEHRIALVNAAILSRAAPGGYTPIRFDLDSRIGGSGASANLMYWSGDRTHPNSNGYAVMAEIIDNAVACEGCIAPGACPADFDRDGLVSPDDLDGFVTAYFAAETDADFDRDGLLSPDDLDGFLTAYFAGC